MTDRADGKQEDVRQTPTPYELEETLAADMEQVSTTGASIESEPPRVFGR